MINITSAEGVITIVITEGEARELQKACRHYVDMHTIYGDRVSAPLSSENLEVSKAMRPLREAIIKHV